MPGDHAGPTAMERMAEHTRSKALRRAALAVALVHLALGLLGTLPPAHIQWMEIPDALLVRNGSGLLLGVMPNNLVLTAVRIGVGAFGLAASRGSMSSVRFLRIVTIGSALLAGLSVVPGGGTAFGVAPIAGVNVWFHVAIAIASGIAGWSRGARALIKAASIRNLAPSIDTARLAHQLLAPFPLVCLIEAALADLAFWWTTRAWYNGSGPFWERASLWLIGAGLATGVLCALAGAVIRRRADSNQRSGEFTPHSLVATFGLAVTAINVSARATSPDLVSIVVGTGLSVTAATAVTASYWAGLAAVRREQSSHR